MPADMRKAGFGNRVSAYASNLLHDSRMTRPVGKLAVLNEAGLSSHMATSCSTAARDMS